MQKNLSFCIERKVGVEISPLESQISLDTGRNIIYVSYVHLTNINSISKSCQINQISKIFRGAIAFAVLLFQIPDCNCGVATGEKYQRMFTFERTKTERTKWKNYFHRRSYARSYAMEIVEYIRAWASSDFCFMLCVRSPCVVSRFLASPHVESSLRYPRLSVGVKDTHKVGPFTTVKYLTGRTLNSFLRSS